MGEINWTQAQSDAIKANGVSIAVSAAAGSGKTAVLTRRITERICSGSVDVSRILVVTFTRAAAAELVERIEKSLSDEYSKNPKNSLLRQMLLVSSAKISTIDSFCIDLIKENFQETGVSGFGIMDADAEKILKNEIADELISDYFEGIVRGSGKIDDFALFADTFGSPSSDSKLRETLVGLYDFYSGCVNREKAIKGEPSGGDFEVSFWGKAIYGIIAYFLRHYINFYKIALDEMYGAEGTEKRINTFETDLRFSSALLDSIESSKPYADVRNAFSSLCKSFTDADCGSIKKDFNCGLYKWHQSVRKKFVEEARGLFKTYFSLDESTLSDMLVRAEHLRDDLSSFFDEFDRRLMDEKKRRHMISFADAERMALNLLYDEENDSPTALAKELSERFDEIYIDEFQDTDELQNKIFTLIAKEDNLFTVGDMKQSIYDFRGAEPAIFARQLESRKKYEKGTDEKAVKMFLSENFRSGNKIIDIVNGVFSTLMNTDGKIVYGDDERLRRGGDEVPCPTPEMHIICTSDDNPSLTEEAYVAEKIASMIADGEAKATDIAILLRSNKIAQDIALELSKRGVPCRNASVKEFFKSPEVLLTLSLLNTIDNPSRDVYLAATLKSPIYGVTLEELIRIRKSDESGSLYSALREYTEKTGFEKGKRFLSDHEKFRSRAKICTCGELLKTVYAETKIMSLLGTDERSRVNLRRLYDYALDFENGGNHGLYSFTSFIDEMINTDAKVDMTGFGGGADAVTIMTMHGSKGLEFDTVFLCDTNRQTNSEHTRGNVLAVRNAPVAFDLYDGAEGGKIIETPMHRAAIELQSGRLAEEGCRLLYVALTRAKRRLIITATVKDNTRAKDNQKDQEQKYDFGDPSSDVSLKAKLFSSYGRKKSKSMLEWLCIGLAKDPSLCKLDFVRELPRRETVTGAESDIVDNYDEGYAIARDRLSFEYPHAILSKVPSKLSVSKLYPDVLDDDDGTAVSIDNEKNDEYPAPVFIAGESESGTSHGTAMHTFMQFFDFENVDKNGVEAEIQRLVKNRFIFESDSEKLNVQKLKRFFSSPLAAVMKEADRIYREKRFIIFYPAESFSEDEKTKEALKGEKLMVQGVIDCAVKTKTGELILIDYKTDFFPSGTGEEEIKETLIKRHSRQLGYYKYACKKLFGKAPEHTYIYSFALDGTIEL